MPKMNGSKSEKKEDATLCSLSCSQTVKRKKDQPNPDLNLKERNVVDSRECSSIVRKKKKDLNLMKISNLKHLNLTRSTMMAIRSITKSMTRKKDTKNRLKKSHKHQLLNLTPISFLLKNLTDYRLFKLSRPKKLMKKLQLLSKNSRLNLKLTSKISKRNARRKSKNSSKNSRKNPKRIHQK